MTSIQQSLGPGYCKVLYGQHLLGFSGAADDDDSLAVLSPPLFDVVAAEAAAALAEDAAAEAGSALSFFRCRKLSR